MKKKTFAKKYGVVLVIILGVLLTILLVGALIRSVQDSNTGSDDEGSDSFGEVPAPLGEVYQTTVSVGDILEDDSLIVIFSVPGQNQESEENAEALQDYVIQIVPSKENLEVVRLSPDKSYQTASWDDIEIEDSITIYSDTNLIGDTIPIEVSYVTILSQ